MKLTRRRAYGFAFLAVFVMLLSAFSGLMGAGGQNTSPSTGHAGDSGNSDLSASFGPASGQVGTVMVGTNPRYVTYDSGNGYVYVTTGSNNVTVLSGTTKVGTVMVGTTPYGAAYDSGNGYVYVANYGSKNVTVLSGTTKVGTVMVGTNPYFATYDSGNGYVYVPNYGSNNVTVLSGTTKVGTVMVGTNPYDAAYDSGNGYVYVANLWSNNVTVLSGTTKVGTVMVGTNPRYATYDSGNGYVYVPNSGSNNVTVISGTTNVGTVMAGTTPYGAAYDSGNGYVYVPNSGSKNVTVLSGTTKVGTVMAGTTPYSMAYDSGNGYVYVTNSGSSNVTVLSGTTKVGTVMAGTTPYYTTYDSGHGYVYVPNYGSNNVTVLGGAPGAPTLTSLIATASSTNVTVTWTNPLGTIVNNTVYSTTTAACAGTLVAHSTGGAASTYVIPGPLVYTIEYIEVTAWNATGQSLPSSCVSIEPYGADVAPVLSAAGGYASATVTWSVAMNYVVTNYTLEYGTTYGTYGTHVSEGTSTFHATITGLAANTTYYFVILTWTGASTQGPSSNVASAHTQPLTPLVVYPPVLAAAGGYDNAVLTWTAAVNVTVVNYTLEYGTVFGTYGTHVSEGTSTFTTTITGLAANTTYYFLIATWMGASTQGPSSNVASAHTQPLTPLVVYPPVLAAAGGVERAAVAWSAAINVTVVNYTLEYGTTYGTYGTHVSEGASTFHATITGLAANTTYYFIILTWTGASTQGPSSNVVSAQTQPPTPLAVYPPVLVAAGGYDNAVLTWTAAVNVTVVNYTLEYGTVFGTYGTHVSEGTSTFTTTITGLAANTTYYFLIATWTGASTQGPSSNVASAHTQPLTPLVVYPPVLAAAGGVERAAVAWSAAINVTVVNYTLEYGTTYGTYGTHVSEGASTFHATITGLAANTTYYFLVATWTGASTQGPSSNVAVAITAGLIYVLPFLSVAAASTTTVNAAWTAPQNESYSNAYLKWSSTYGGSYVGSATLCSGSDCLVAGSLLVTGLSPDTTYWFVVVLGVHLSNWAPATTWYPLPAVLTVNANSTTTVTGQWTDPVGIVVTSISFCYGTEPSITACESEATNALSGTWSGFSPSTTYGFVVEFNSLYYSNWANATTLAVQPAVLTVNAISTTAVTGIWTDPVGIYVSSIIFCRGTPPALNACESESTSATSGTWSGLSPNTTYSFVVEFNSLYYSNWANATTWKLHVVPPVLSCAATGMTSVACAWTPEQNVTFHYYALFWGLTPGSRTWSADELFSLDVTVTGLAINTTYYFQVLMWTGSAYSSTVSNMAPVQTWAPVVVPPTLSATVLSQTVVQLSWTAGQNITANDYNIYWSQTKGNHDYSDIVSGSTFDYVVDGLTSNTTWWFVVGTTTDGGLTWGHYSNWAPAHTLAWGAVVPVLSVVAESTTSVSAVWSEAQNIAFTNYVLEWGLANNTPTWHHNAGGDTSVVITGLTPGTTYFFVVWLYDGAILRTGTSNWAVAHTWLHTPLPPPAPTNPQSIGVSDSAILVTWIDAQGYNITVDLIQVFHGSTCSGSAIEAFYIVAANNSTVGSLNSGTTYSFDLEALNFSQNSYPSWCTSAMTFYAPPSAPYDLVSWNTSTTILVQWTAPSGILLNFTFAWGLVNGSFINVVSVGLSTVYTISGLGANTTVYFVVSAWTSGGMSPWSSVGHNMTGPYQPPPPPPPPPPPSYLSTIGMLVFVAIVALIVFGLYTLTKKKREP